VYDDWYGDVTDVDACVERLAGLLRAAGGGPVLELGVGSGRLALSLADRGHEVHGIDASPAMVRKLRSKDGAERVRVVEGDMAELALPRPPSFALVFVAYNTFFNLPSAAAQARCLERVADVLRNGGWFVLEAFVPAEPDGGASGVLTPRSITRHEVVLTASQHDPHAQTITGQHIHVTEAGIRLRPWHLRYAPPAELDVMAAGVGLHLAERHADWSGAPFGPDSGVHVSVYRRGNVRTVRPPAADHQ
jgi:SAM-dependent methyltransferase